MIQHPERLGGLLAPIPDCVLFISQRAHTELGLDTLVVFGFRSIAQQNALWAQGRGFSLEYVNQLRADADLSPIGENENSYTVTNAIGGESGHNHHAAVDLVGVLNGVAQWKNDAFFKIVGEEAEKLGLKWGVIHKGKRSDLGHIENIEWKSKVT